MSIVASLLVSLMGFVMFIDDDADGVGAAEEGGAMRQ